MIEVNKQFVKQLIPLRAQNSNKGTFGKVLVIAGSKDYTGAGMMASLSALRVGAGYSFLCSDEYSINTCRGSAYDLIYKSHGDFDFESIRDFLCSQKFDVIVFGCGIGVNEKTLLFTQKLIQFIKENNIFAVFDADGLNCLARQRAELSENFVLTPHPKELARLLDVSLEDVVNSREKALAEAYSKYHANILLKGKNTLLTDGKEIFKNMSGSSALAKAGTGDILAGMIGGFIAQKMRPIDASVAAVYLHGLAAEIYSDDYTEYSMLASDLLKYIPLAIKSLLAEEVK